MRKFNIAVGKPEKVKLLDTNGYFTGEYKSAYLNILELEGCIQSLQLENELKMYGEKSSGMLNIYLEHKRGIEVTSPVWIGVPTTEEPNYRVCVVDPTILDHVKVVVERV